MNIQCFPNNSSALARFAGRASYSIAISFLAKSVISIIFVISNLVEKRIGMPHYIQNVVKKYTIFRHTYVN